MFSSSIWVSDKRLTRSTCQTRFRSSMIHPTLLAIVFAQSAQNPDSISGSACYSPRTPIAGCFISILDLQWKVDFLPLEETISNLLTTSCQVHSPVNNLVSTLVLVPPFLLLISLFQTALKIPSTLFTKRGQRLFAT